jgi:hypothetical protein
LALRGSLELGSILAAELNRQQQQQQQQQQQVSKEKFDSNRLAFCSFQAPLHFLDPHQRAFHQVVVSKITTTL